MTNPRLVPACIVLACIVGACRAGDHPPAAKPVTLMPGLGSHHHKVSTQNAEAQRFFDQGFRLIFAFNHEEAIRSFRKAAELDPELAMAYWGIALAMGSNINTDATSTQEVTAYETAQKAMKLATKATEKEQAYIAALAKRYSDDPKADRQKLAVAYKTAVGELAKRYPDDLDAAALYAESMMNLNPWRFWSLDGKPAEGTEEIVGILESVLRREPDHLGANHYYIHAVEASSTPGRALPCAERLKWLAPAAGHLVHMPSHIYFRVGDYDESARRNVLAIEADEAYMKATGMESFYTMEYYSHNIHFLAVSEAMQGRFAAADQAAAKLVAHVGPHVKDMPMLEGFLPTRLLIQVRCRRWEEILKTPAPDAKLVMLTAYFHFARGMAYAGTGKLVEAEAERTAFRAAVKKLPADLMYSRVNKASAVLSIADDMLEARIAVAKKDYRTAIELLKAAVKIEDTLSYYEPPDWYLPAREALGGALLLHGDAVEAEKVFLADLEKNPRNGRSLFGLLESYQAQKKTYAIPAAQQEFEAAWKNADTKLKVEDL